MPRQPRQVAVPASHLPTEANINWMYESNLDEDNFRDNNPDYDLTWYEWRHDHDTRENIPSIIRRINSLPSRSSIYPAVTHFHHYGREHLTRFLQFQRDRIRRRAIWHFMHHWWEPHYIESPPVQVLEWADDDAEHRELANDYFQLLDLQEALQNSNHLSLDRMVAERPHHT